MATQAALILGVKELVQDSVFTSDKILDYLNQGVRQIAGGIFFRYPDGTQIISSPLPDLSTNSELTTSITLPYISMPSDFGRDLFFLVSSTNKIEIELYESYTEFLRAYPNLDNTSRVIAASVRGNRLYYQGYPGTAETLIGYYYRNPHDMATLTGGVDITFTATTLRIADAGGDLDRFYAGQIIDVTGTSLNNTNFTIASVESDGSYLTTTAAPVLEANTSAVIKSRPDGIPVHLHESLLKDYCAWEIFKLKTKNDPQMETGARKHQELFLRALINMETAIETVPGSTQFSV